MSIWGRMCVYMQFSTLNARICTSSPPTWSRNTQNTIIYLLNRQQHTIEICIWHIIDNNKGQYILSIDKSRVSISISNMENNCMWKQYFMYKDSLGWAIQRVLVHEVLFLFSIFEIEMLILLWAILKIYWPLLLLIICHVQISIVCYCLFNI